MTLKDFQKFVKKGPPKGKSKNVLSPAGSWLANATKSMGYAMLDVTGQIAPNTIEHLRSAKENADIVKDAVMSAKGSASKQIRTAIERNDYIQMAREGVQNALEDLKTGKFYNQERRQKFISDQMGGDFEDFDVDFGSGWETEGEFSADDDGSSVRVSSAGKNGVHVSNISMSNNIGEGSPIVEATNYQTATIAKGTEALANVNIANTQIVSNILSRIGEEQGRSFAALTSTVSDVGSEINTKLTELTGLSATYYNDSMSVLKEINESIKAIRTSSSAGTATQAARSPRELKDALAVIGAGGTLNFSAYKEMVQKNAKSWAESDFIASTLIGMVSQKDTIRDMMQMPLKFVVDSVVNTIIPETVKSAAKNMDAMVGEFITTGLTQLGSMRNSTNPIMSALGQIFGIRQDMRTSINRGNYEKGKVDFDGITHRTINEVIPTYLRQMVSLLSGREEMGYDYEKGMFRSIRSMEEDYQNTIKRNKLNPFSDDISQFNKMLDTQFTSRNKSEIDVLKKEFENAILKLVNSGGIENYRKVYDRNGNVRDPLAELLTGMSDDHIEIVRGFLEGRTRTDGGNAANARMFGSSIQDARSAVSRTNMQMEMNPYATNAQYQRNGLEGHTNAHLRIPRVGESGSRIRAVSGITAGVIDKYGHSVVDYARDISKILMKGIVVYPAIQGSSKPSSGDGGSPGGSSIPRIVDRYGNVLEAYDREASKLSANERIRERENTRYDRQVEEGRIDVSNMDGLNAEQVALVSAESIREEQGDDTGPNKASLLQRLRNGNGTLAKWAGKIDDRVQQGSGILAKGFKSADDFLYGLLFGDGKTKGLRYLFDKVWDGMKLGFSKLGSFLDKSILKPLDDMLFGEDGIFTKFKESQFYKDISSKFKNASEFFGERIFGKKVEGPNGVTYEGGLISNTINAFGDIGRVTKEAILGGMGSDGKPLPPDKDKSIVGGIKRAFNNTANSIADTFGLKSKDNKNGMTFKELMGTAVHSTMDRFKERASGFLDNIFGKASDSEFIRNGRDVLNNFKTEMEGKGGFLAAGGILGAVGVPILSSSMGLLGSIFLPGGPIGGALVGAGISFVTQSETLKTKLFGEKDENGERMGGIVSKSLQNIFKENKTGIAAGAGLGLISSWGLLPGLFLPGGPLGGAIIGAGISMVTKSKAFSDLLYGPDGTKDDPTGGLIERFKAIFGKNKDLKGLAMDAAIGGGIGLIGSFFLPGGPIVGSLIGAGVSIVTNTERFKKIMFGNEEFDKDGNSLGRHGGLVGKFTQFLQKKAVFPFMKKFEEMQVNLEFFIKDKIVRPVSIALAPITHKLIDVGEGIGSVIKATFDRIGETFEQIVLKPVGDAIDKFIIRPIKGLANKLWKGFTSILGTIISAPFALIGAVGKGIYKSDMNRGERAAVNKAKQDRNSKAMEQLRSGKILSALGTFTSGTFNAYRPKTRIEGRHSKDGAGWYASKTNNPILNDKRIHAENLSERDRRFAEIEAKYANKGSGNRQNIRKSRKNVNERIATQAEDSAKIQEQTLSETSQIADNTAKISTSTGAIMDWLRSLGDRFRTGRSKSEPTEETTDNKKQRRVVRGGKFKNATFVRGKKGANTDSEETSPESAESSSTDIHRVSATDNSESSKSRNLGGRSILDYVRLIHHEVDGNLNGVGYNVNKLYRLFLRKFNLKDDDVGGGKNKKYRTLLGRFADFVGTPVRALKDIALSPFRIAKSIGTSLFETTKAIGSGIIGTIKGIGSGITSVIATTIGGIVGGVGDILAALASIPGNLLKIGATVITESAKLIGSGIQVAANVLTTSVQVAGETLVVGIRSVGNVIQGVAEGLGTAIGNTIAGLSSMASGIMKLGGGLMEGAGKLGKGLLGGLGEIGKGVGKGIGGFASGVGNLLGAGITGLGSVFGIARPVYVVGGKLNNVELVGVVSKVRKVNNVRKERPAEGGNGGFGGFGSFGGFGIPKPIQKVFVEGGYLDGIREEEKKGATLTEPEQSAMQSIAERLDETLLAGTGAQIRSDQATATDNGSAKSIREGWKKEKAEEQAAKAAEEETKQTGLLTRIAGSTEEHKGLFDRIFGPKGKIAMLLMMAIPFIVDFFKHFSIQDIVSGIVGAIPSMLRGALTGVESITNGIRGTQSGGGENGTGYQTDENGSIVTDENGNPISNPKRGKRTALGIARDIIFPTRTRIDPKTGRASTERYHDGISEILVHHGARIGTQVGVTGVRAVKKAIPAVKAMGGLAKATSSYVNAAAKYSKHLGFIQRTTPGAGSKIAHEFAAKATGGKGKLLGTAMNKVGNSKIGQAASKVVKGNGVIAKFIEIAKKGLTFLGDKLTEFITKHGAKKGAEAGILATLKKAASTLSETTLGKFATKIATAVGNFAAGLTPAAVANIAFAGLAFINANPAQVFNVDKSAVDFKMQLIARAMKSFLGTSYGMIFDVLFEIVNSLFGFDIGKELCVLAYNAISSKEDKANLSAAQKEFDAEWKRYQDSEYDAYCEHELALGNTPMTREAFDAAGLTTTKAEFNRNKNKTIMGHVMSGVTSAWNGAKSVGKKVGGALSTAKGAIVGAAGKAKSFVTNLPGNITRAASKGATGAINLMGVNSFEEALAHPVTALGQGVFNIAKGGAGLLGKGIDKVGRGLLGDKVMDSITGFVKPIFEKISSFTQGAIDIKKVADEAHDNVMKAAVTTGKISTADKVKLDANDPLLNYKTFAASASKLMSIPGGLIACLGYHVGNAMKKFFGWIPSLGGKIQQIHSDNLQEMENGAFTVGNYGDGVEGGLLGALDMADQGFLVVGGAVKKLVGGIAGTVQAFFGGLSKFGSTINEIHSRHKSEMENGEMTVGNYGDGFSGKLFSVIDIIDQVGLVMFGAFNKTVKGIVDTTRSIVSGVAGFGKRVIEIPARHIKQVLAGEQVTVGQYGNGPIELTLLGMDLASATVMTPIGGIASMLKSVTDKIGGMVKTIGTDLTSATEEAFNVKDDVNLKDYFRLTLKSQKGQNVISSALSGIVFNAIRMLMLPIYAIQTGVSGLFGKMGDMVNGVLDKLGFGSTTEVTTTQPAGGRGGYGGDNTYVSQNDPALANQPYRLSDGTYDTFRNRGCGPAAMTMVANKMGHSANPLDVANDATRGGYSTEVGTRTEFFGNEASRFGMRSSKKVATESNLNASLGGYGPVIIQGADDNPNSPFTPQGHYVVGNKVSGDMIDIDDPRGPQYSGLYKTSEVAKGAKNMWSFDNGKSSGGYGLGRIRNRQKLGGFGATSILNVGAQNMSNGGGVCPRKVVEIAAKELGYLEKASNAQLDDKTANAGRGNYTKYNRDMKLCNINDYWCCSFVCWVFTQACGGDRERAKRILCGRLSASCSSLMGAFQRAGKFDKNPIVGDCVFFPGSRHSGANHIAIVVGVEGNTIYTVEGNTSDGKGVIDNGGGVCFKTHQISACLGFGHPQYESWENNYAGIKNASGLALSGGSSPFGGSSSSSSSGSALGSIASGISGLGGFLSSAAGAMLKPLFTLLGLDSGTESSSGETSYVGVDGSNVIARTSDGDELGAYVKKFESGSKGPSCVSSGTGDYGGMSFGTYQMASYGKNPVGTDNPIYKFWNQYGYAQKYPGVKPGASQQFKNTWLKAVQEDPNFAKNEHDFYVSEFYTPGVQGIAKYIGGDVNDLSRGAQEAAWSTIIQHGGGDDTKSGKGAPQIFKSAGVKATMDNREFLEKLYDYKISSVPTRFKSSSASVQNGVKNRFMNEKQVVLQLADTPPLGKSSTGGAKSSGINTNLMTSMATNALSTVQNLNNQGGMGGYGGRPVIPRSQMDYGRVVRGSGRPARYTPIDPTPNVSYRGGYGAAIDSQIAEKLDKIDITLQAIASSSSGTNSGVAKLFDKDFGSATTNNNNFNSINVGGQGGTPKKQTSFKDMTGRDRSGYAAAKQLAAGGLLGT